LEHRSAAEVCREHEIHPTMLTNWKKEYKKDPEHAFSGHGTSGKRMPKLGAMKG
jgi:transposase-like protein